MSEWDQIERANAARQRRYWQDKADTTGQDTSAHVNYWNQFIDEIDKGEGWQDRVNQLATDFQKQQEDQARQQARQQVPQVNMTVPVQNSQNQRQEEPATLEYPEGLNQEADQEREEEEQKNDDGGLLGMFTRFLSDAFLPPSEEEKQRRLNNIQQNTAGQKSQAWDRPSASMATDGASGQELESRNAMKSAEQNDPDLRWKRDNADQVYEDYFKSQGWSPDQEQPEGFWEPTWRAFTSGNVLANSDAAQLMEQNPELYDWATTHATDYTEGLRNAEDQSRDNGSLNNENLTSTFVTKEQLDNYIDLGLMGTLTHDDIKYDDPGTVYNKVDLARDYNARFYKQGDLGVGLKQAGQTLGTLPSRLFSELSNARENLTDYKVNLPSGTKASGDELDSNKVYAFYRDAQRITDPSQASDTDSGYTYVFNEGTADEIVLRGAPREVWYNDDGSISMLTSTENPEDGLTFYGDETMTPLEEYRQYIAEDGNFTDRVSVRVSNDGETPAFYMPSYQLSNGQYATYDDLNQFYGDRDGTALSYDFGPLNIGMPKKFTEDSLSLNPFETDWTKIVPNLLDIGASSAAYFNPYIAVPTALSDAYSTAMGVDPRSTSMGKAQQVYGDIADATKQTLIDLGIDPDELDEKRKNDITSRVIGNAIMPASEYAFGGIGPKAIPGIMGALAKKIGTRAWMPAAEFAEDIAGEGLEEIFPGNAMESLANHGAAGWYAPQLMIDPDTGLLTTDKSKGIVLRDSSGVPLLDYGADAYTRWNNYLADADEAAASGALLAGALKAPSIGNVARSTAQIAGDNYGKTSRGYSLSTKDYSRTDVPELDDYFKEYLDEKERF